MIAAIPMPWRYIGGTLVLILVVGGIYGKGRHDERGEWKAREAIAQAAYDGAAAETARIQAEWNKVLGERDELRKELTAARDYGKSVGDRLRVYQSRRCALPDTAGVTPGTERAAQVASLVERIRRLDDRITDLNGRVVEACSGEARQLEAVLDRYEAARQAQNTP